MDKRTENIVGTFVGIALAAHIIGYFFWSLITFMNIYYVSFYFMMLMSGLMFMIISRGIVMKYVSLGMFSLGSQFLFMEFAGDPQNWTQANIWTLVFIFVNSLLLNFFLDKYKKRIKYGTDATNV